MSEDQTNQEVPAENPAATIEVDDRDTFVKLLTGWHNSKVKVLEHFLQLPEDADPPPEMQVGDGEPMKLQGDILRGLKAGVNLALMELGTLPFVVEYEPEDTPPAADTTVVVTVAANDDGS